MHPAAVRRICAGISAAALLAACATGCGDDDEKKADPMKGQQWALDALKLPGAWKKAQGEDTVIAVVDSGVDLDHPDLKGRLVDGYDFVDGDRKPDDGFGHGTHVAGIAAAHTDNGVGIAGGAPAAKIMPVRVLGDDGSGSNGNITRGIVWAADHGADVINLSLGEGPLMSNLLQGGILNAAIRHAHDKGAVVVAAAGNDGAATQPYKVQTPVLVVGASDEDGRPADFSNFGAQNAVSAPGVGILSTLPTHPVKLTEKKNGDVNDSGYGKLDGTSMAAPYVSAVAALLHGEGEKPDAIMKAVRDTAQNPDRLQKLGLGIVNAQAAVDSADD
ncbi:S8 family serine peptidase [Streptomyces sp. SID5785]|uniref:S8 family peptidase n=1 Tax=Streptomyces sp. SID5785 TaxID=2690309 RepID=UPI001360F3DD|nr:S8 family peptidase [Streptomyces sp. SID5785]MZD03900.1 S8 family serine peptidase [Streptomyces sp. SID5785]